MGQEAEAASEHFEAVQDREDLRDLLGMNGKQALIDSHEALGLTVPGQQKPVTQRKAREERAELWEAMDLNGEELRKQMEVTYRKNKSAPVGATCECACCFKPFIKSQYSQAFCQRYVRKRGMSSCKDMYNNCIPADRRARANAVVNGEEPTSAKAQSTDVPAQTGRVYSTKAAGSNTVLMCNGVVIMTAPTHDINRIISALKG